MPAAAGAMSSARQRRKTQNKNHRKTPPPRMSNRQLTSENFGSFSNRTVVDTTNVSSRNIFTRDGGSSSLRLGEAHRPLPLLASIISEDYPDSLECDSQIDEGVRDESSPRTSGLQEDVKSEAGSIPPQDISDTGKEGKTMGDHDNNGINNNGSNEPSSGEGDNKNASIYRKIELRLRKFREIAGRIINDDRVQNCILFLIVMNAIMMGIATFPFVKYDPDLSAKFDLVDDVFLITFSIESGLQLFYHGRWLFKDGFLVFDLVIVALSWALDGTQVFRAFRIFRALRVITRVKVMSNLVRALLSVIPKMGAVLMLMGLIYYIFAVMFTQLFKGMYADGLVEYKYFESLDHSIFTLFQMMCLDTWSPIYYQISETYNWVWAPFSVFIIITGFVVVNLLIAVICDAVSSLNGEDDDLSSTDHDEMKTDRIGELEQHVVVLLEMQEEMQKTIDALSTQVLGIIAADRPP